MDATLIVGFDSAWTSNNAGAIAGVLRHEDGRYELLGEPLKANFLNAREKVREWQWAHSPVRTLILIDQPIIVEDPKQRPVEKIVGSPVGRRYGGVQPANRSEAKIKMFGENAPVREFLKAFGGPCDPRHGKLSGNCVIETYPVLGLIALSWLLDDDHVKPRSTGRLPKYNPKNRNFSGEDWQFVCGKVMAEFGARQLPGLVNWAGRAGKKSRPRKSDQDCLDACLCLLAGLHMAEGKDCLFVGYIDSGYMVVPYGEVLYRELDERRRDVERKNAGFPRTEVVQFTPLEVAGHLL